MVYRARIGGVWVVTANLADLCGVDSVDVMFGRNGLWQVYR